MRSVLDRTSFYHAGPNSNGARSDLGLSQVDFARLIEVTPRAVSLWMVGERAVPGPVKAYARLLLTAPLSARQIELARLIEGGSGMQG